MVYLLWFQKSKRLFMILGLGIVVNLWLIASASAQIDKDGVQYVTAYSHRGIENPLREGWLAAEVYPSNGIEIGPVYDKGVLAWKIDDDSAEKMHAYFAIPPENIIREARKQGWRLTAHLRVVDYPDPERTSDVSEDASPLILYRDGLRSFQIHFLSTADGKLNLYVLRDVNSKNREGFAVEVAGGVSRYHKVSLTYNPSSKRSSIHINNRLKYSGYTGARLTSSPVIMWGAGSTSATGHANFHRFTFAIRHDQSETLNNTAVR